MAYADIDTAFSAAKTAGDLKGKIAASFVRRSVARLAAVGNNEDQREAALCRRITGAGASPTDVLVVLERLDNAATLTNPTDAQIDTSLNQAWNRLTAAS
jgi:hypothetical protein